MNTLKKVKSALTLFLIAAILTVTILPANSLAQTSIPKTREILFNSPVKNDLKTSLQKERYNRLLGSSIAMQTPFDENIGKTAFPDPASKRRAGGGKKWLWIPILAGVGVGVYFLIKYRSENSGILCNDGSYSQAQNRQGACSYHGGIAPGH